VPRLRGVVPTTRRGHERSKEQQTAGHVPIAESAHGAGDYFSGFETSRFVSAKICS
jgi:hypothetical protein